jgi:hypothetical protein
MTFKEKIKKAKETFKSEEDQETLKNREIEHKKASLMVNLGEHPAMKEIVDDLEVQIVDIDSQLNEQEVNNNEDILNRKVLKIKKELYTGFLNRFSDAKNKMIEIEKGIEESLKENAG